MKSLAFKFILYFCLVLAGIYLLFVGGIFIMERTASMSGGKVESVQSQSKDRHAIVLLDRGIDSLYQRIKLIREAKSSIELEFFIFNLDESSLVVTQELIKKAREGLKVRILVDFSKPVFQLKPGYAKYLKDRGIEVKYYNTAPIYRFISAQHRSHRKLLIVDDKKMITGGRNIANEYFDMGTDYNFLDSDILVEGEIVKKARESFDVYFYSDFAETAKKEDAGEEADKLSKTYFENIEKYEDLVGKVDRLANKNLKQYSCDNIIFVTDPPAQGEVHRQIYRTIVEVASHAKNEIIVESPYFVIRRDGHKILEKLHERNIKLHVITNSLNATDAFYSVGSVLLNLRKFSNEGLTVSLLTGAEPGDLASTPLTTGKRWGLHAKRAVIDGKDSIVGTYNMDPRSANLNSEMMIMCQGNEELAKAILADMNFRLTVSEKLLEEGEIKDVGALMRGASLKHKFLFFLVLPVANMFDFLL